MTVAPEIMNRMRSMWGAVDYHPIAVRDVYVGELLARAVDVHPGQHVLDVGAGSGNAALSAARRGARVIATDLVASSLETAARRASCEGLNLRVETADAQDLPFDTDSFDVVMSTFGAMYAPNHARTADELIRVCRPGGRIGLASWTPGGLVGRLQGMMAKAMAQPPNAGAKPGGSGPPTLWGTEAHCRELFGDRVKLTSAVRIHEYCAATAEAQVRLLLDHLPPWHIAFKALTPEKQEEISAAAIAEFERANRAQDGTNIAEAEYLEVVATVV
ncbi:class I SAM-dependent methyltransferase [Nocardia sp. CS682]|uniref:class I SAM-dependent methyltransferase n=1 Tax=Nocardia sp. CS682 TaxID=1047172 RepID=UPI001074B92F|nr:class I SAM-dependent methyltransferase [Nocardia sp. CS682]QBS44878.1 SAM-dependent methyltransferase [Nocardia sp. CS682]